MFIPFHPRDSCKEDGRKHDRTCYNFYKDNEVSDGCGLFGPMGNSEVISYLPLQFAKANYGDI